MEKILLDENLSNEDKILFLIDAVKEFEKEQGLSEEEIIYKYTHGECGSLARLINQFVKSAKIRWMGTHPYDHYFVRIKNPDIDNEASKFFGFEYVLFDIHGKVSEWEMEEFIINELMTEKEREIHLKSNKQLQRGFEDGLNRDTKATAYVASNIEIINLKNSSQPSNS